MICTSFELSSFGIYVFNSQMYVNQFHLFCNSVYISPSSHSDQRGFCTIYSKYYIINIEIFSQKYAETSHSMPHPTPLHSDHAVARNYARYDTYVFQCFYPCLMELCCCRLGNYKLVLQSVVRIRKRVC